MVFFNGDLPRYKVKKTPFYKQMKEYKYQPTRANHKKVGPYTHCLRELYFTHINGRKQMGFHWGLFHPTYRGYTPEN